jgi:glutathione S-transferase
LQVRLRDRFYDLHVHEAMQKIVGDRIRPDGKRDPFGVEQARATLTTAYDVIEREMAKKTWAIGDAFTMADCAAAPALYYANKVQPLGATHANIASYLERLQARPSFARVLREAEPYFSMFPQG